MAAANDPGLTNAVPAKIVVHTDARLKTITIGKLDIVFKPTAPSKLNLAGRPGMRVFQTLHWLRDTMGEGDGNKLDRRLQTLFQGPQGQWTRGRAADPAVVDAGPAALTTEGRGGGAMNPALARIIAADDQTRLGLFHRDCAAHRNNATKRRKRTWIEFHFPSRSCMSRQGHPARRTCSIPSRNCQLSYAGRTLRPRSHSGRTLNGDMVKLEELYVWTAPMRGTRHCESQPAHETFSTGLSG
jgi:hypothetical protein